MSARLIAMVVGGVIGAISIVLLVSQHPVHVGIIVLGAAVYFVGDKLLK